MRKQFIRYWTFLFKYLKGKLLLFTALMFLMICSIALQIINPQIIKNFIDDISKMNDYNHLIMQAIIFILVAYIQQILVLVITYLSKNIGWNATNKIRKDLLSHCLSLDMDFFKKFSSGELIDRIDGDLNIILDFFSQLIITILNNLILILGILVIFFKENILLGISESMLVLITAFTFTKLQKIAVPYWSRFREFSSKFYGLVSEHFAARNDIKGNGASAYSKKMFHFNKVRWFPVYKTSNILSYSMYSAFIIIVAFSYSIIFGIGTYLWQKHSITVGTIYLLYTYNSYLISPIDQIRGKLRDMQKVSAIIDRIEEIFSIKSAVEDSNSDLILNDRFDICVKNVSFEYEKDIKVLKDISFSISQNRKVGIIGKTGSGKTTLARLLVRLIDPTEGEITFDNLSSKNYSINMLREKISYVTQEVQLFKSTLRNNITFFDESISDEKIIIIMEEIGLKEWYESLNEGLNTSINNNLLSSGEAQLIALIRTFLKDSSLVVLDEVSSKLDAITERYMQNALMSLLKNRSSVIIAHKLWTLDFCDDLIIIDNGEIVEYGEMELLRKDDNSIFSNLLRKGISEVLE